MGAEGKSAPPACTVPTKPPPRPRRSLRAANASSRIAASIGIRPNDRRALFYDWKDRTERTETDTRCPISRSSDGVQHGMRHWRACVAPGSQSSNGRARGYRSTSNASRGPSSFAQPRRDSARGLARVRGTRSGPISAARVRPTRRSAFAKRRALFFGSGELRSSRPLGAPLASFARRRRDGRGGVSPER